MSDPTAYNDEDLQAIKDHYLGGDGYRLYIGSVTANTDNWALELDRPTNLTTVTPDTQYVIGDIDKDAVDWNEQNGLDSKIKGAVGQYLRRYHGSSYERWYQVPLLIRFMTVTCTGWKDYTGEVGKEIINLYDPIYKLYMESNRDTAEDIIIVHRTKRFLRNFVIQQGLKTTDIKEIDQTQKEIFSLYRNILIRDGSYLEDNEEPFYPKESLILLQQSVVRYDGDSEYLNQLYGKSIADNFNLQNFKDIIDEHITDYIDRKIDLEVESIVPTNQGVNYSYPNYANPDNGPIVIETAELNKGGVYDTQIWKEVTLKDVFKKNGALTAFYDSYDRHVGSYPKHIDLKKSPVYDKPTTFGKIEVISKSRDLYNSEHTKSETENPELTKAISIDENFKYEFTRLGNFLDPIEETTSYFYIFGGEVSDYNAGVDDII